MESATAAPAAPALPNASAETASTQPTTTTTSKQYTLEEIAKHNTAESCWLMIGNSTNGGPKVYDVTQYLDDHPGGAEVMLDVAGQDADEFFEDIGHSKEARQELKQHYIGDLYLDPETLEKMAAAAAAAQSKKAAGGGVSSPVVVLGLLVAVLAVALGFYQTIVKRAAEENATQS